MTRHALWANSPDSMPRDSNSDFVLILTYFSSIFSLTQILEKKVEIKKKSPLESLGMLSGELAQRASLVKRASSIPHLPAMAAAAWLPTERVGPESVPGQEGPPQFPH